MNGADPDSVGWVTGPDAEYWNEHLGPFYDTAGLQRAFGWSPETIDAMAKSHVILKLETSDGVVVFPAYCFDATGKTIPHLPLVISGLMAREFSDPWSIAMWLNTHADEWDGRSAVELLRTDLADEVIAQAAEHGRSPLWARAKQAEQMALARPILDRFVELVADLPVSIAKETLFVTRETEVPYGVFLLTLDGIKGSLQVMRFEFGGDPEESAMRMAARIRSELHEQALVSRRTKRRPQGNSTKNKKR
jgi:hypothetical protein